jgi:hypothetical protein
MMMAQDCKTPFATTVLGFLLIRQPDQRLARAVRRSANDSPDVDAGFGFGRGDMRVRVAFLRPLLVAADLTSSYRQKGTSAIFRVSLVFIGTP